MSLIELDTDNMSADAIIEEGFGLVAMGLFRKSETDKDPRDAALTADSMIDVLINMKRDFYNRAQRKTE